MSEGLSYGSREGRGVLLAAILGSGVAFLDATVVNVALPLIGRRLGAGLSGLQWTLDAYLLTLTAFLLPGGALGDRLGRRRVFVAGLAGFGLASALCGLAPSAAWLVAARALQGLAAALLVPGSLALLRACFREEDAPRAIGTWAALSGVTTAIAPLAGGWLAEAVSWRAIFLVNLPFVAVAAWAATRFVRESRDPAGGAPDLAGGALAAAGLGGLVYALVEAPARGRAVLPLALAGVGALAAFAAVERRAAHPMLPGALFRSRAFTGVNATTLAVYFGLGGAMFLLALQLQRGLGWSPVAAGAALVPVTLLILLLSPTAGRLSGRLGARPFLVAGPLLVGAGLLLLGRVAPGARWATAVLPGAAALGLGLAITVSPLTAAALAAVPVARAGVASAVNNAVARLAGLLAVAVLPAAAGISADDLARGDLTAGYARAMAISAAVSAAGALVALVALPGRAKGARRLAAAAALLVALPAPAADPFAARREEMVSEQLAARGLHDPRVLEAMRAVPRHEFVPASLRDEAYADHPLPIGHDQTISQPWVVARMTELAQVRPGARVLEIGTGSGYQAAVLARLAGEVWSIEIVEPLAREARERLARLGVRNVAVRAGDGYAGWPEHAPFDAILVTAAPPKIPAPLLDQLAPGGRLVAPVGGRDLQELVVVTRTPEGLREERVALVRFVPMTGEAQRK